MLMAINSWRGVTVSCRASASIVSCCGSQKRIHAVTEPADCNAQSCPIPRARASEGTVELGKRANLLLLDSDPTVDIRNLDNIAAVILKASLLKSLPSNAAFEDIDVRASQTVSSNHELG